MQIIKRAFEILPKKKKKIKLLYFNHVPDADSNDTIIIRYRFTNAIYYTLDGKDTFETRHVIMRPDSERKLLLTVHGFMRKSKYAITAMPNDVYITKLIGD
ncbi:hypothetical protein HYN59_03445 [Flavobacterium album]|uniref:Uncharacterized protein n=1 Tax=Flavobacterium album TaxID=2175091 RepID=A0A2S1QV29_9FLAO|nr:hypothetical protein HYN59_03445 [Flavobacterium album]